MANTTKRMLSMSLKKLLSKTTLDNITIQDITDDAEVSRKTFYYHFQDIYDLLDWTLQEDARIWSPTKSIWITGRKASPPCSSTCRKTGCCSQRVSFP
ncbi:MAG: TetR family transcriptional regulator [Christensenellales bacterium]